MKILLLFMLLYSFLFSEEGIIFNFAFMKNKENIDYFLLKNKDLDLILLPKDDGISIRSKCINLKDKYKYIDTIKSRNLDFFILKDKCNTENIIIDNLKTEETKQDTNKLRNKISINIPEENFIELSIQKNVNIENNIINLWKPKVLSNENFIEDNVNSNIMKSLNLIEKNDLTAFDYFDNLIYKNIIDDNMKNYIAYQYGKFSYINNFDKLYEIKKFNRNQKFYFIYGLSRNNNYYDISVDYLYNDFDPLLGALIAQELYKNNKIEEAETIIDKSYQLNNYNPYISLTYIEIKYNLGKITKEEQKKIITKIKKFNKEMEIEEWVKKYY